jgi:hypothetical protein
MENRTQTFTRWIRILEAAEQGEPLDHSQTQASLDQSAGKHRARIVACLRAIDAYHAGQPIRFDGPVPDLELPAAAIRGARAAEAVWEAYLLATLGSEPAAAWLVESIHALNPTALRAGVDDNPEPWWANELLILHAFTSFARLRRDASLDIPLGRCVEFHLAEIQPDHATNEPWAVHAYAMHEEGNVTAETLLHAAMVQGSGALTPVARLVVRDALRALRA